MSHNALSPEEQEDVDFVGEYDKKIRSFEWRVDADKANKAFLDNSFSPLHTTGIELQKAMSNYRASVRDLISGMGDPEDLAGHAYNARLWIEEALDRGIIVEGDGLTGNLDMAKKKIEELEGDKIRLENQITLLTKKVEKLEEEKKSFKALREARKKS